MFLSQRIIKLHKELITEQRAGSRHLEYQDDSAVQAKLCGCFLIRDIRNHTTATALAPVTIWDENPTKGVSAS